MDYAGFVTAITQIMVVPSSNADFQLILPTIIQYAEERIYRDLDFLDTRIVSSSTSVTPSSRNFSTPDDILVVEGISLIVPSPNTPAAGTRVSLERASLDFIDLTWPTEATTAVPVTGSAYFAMLDAFTAVIAPTPPAAYKAEVTGTYRPDPLSMANTTTYITLTYPDLMVAAAMVFAAGYQRDFGAQSDDPAMAQSWENQYKNNLLPSAVAEEQRRKSQGTNWSPYSATPNSTPRG